MGNIEKNISYQYSDIQNKVIFFPVLIIDAATHLDKSRCEWNVVLKLWHNGRHLNLSLYFFFLKILDVGGQISIMTATNAQGSSSLFKRYS
jgi:hypothetical protein